MENKEKKVYPRLVDSVNANIKVFFPDYDCLLRLNSSINDIIAALHDDQYSEITKEIKTLAVAMSTSIEEYYTSEPFKSMSR